MALSVCRLVMIHVFCILRVPFLFCTIFLALGQQSAFAYMVKLYG